MNLLVLTTSYPAGPDDSAGRFVHDLMRAMAARGHAVRVVTPGRAGALGRRDLDGIPAWHFRYAFSDAGHRLTSVPGGIPEALRRHRGVAARLPAMLACFAAAAARHADWADAIWAHWLGAGLVGGIVRTVARPRPMLLTLRGDDAYLVRDRLAWRAVGRLVLAQCAAVSAVSGNMVPLVEPLMPRRARPMLVPRFGVDTERFCPPAGRAAGAGRPRGLFVGNLTLFKGLDLLIGALARCPGAWERFTLVGDGADAAAVRAKAAEAGIADRLDWVGRRPPGEIPDLMRSHDLFVLPSRSEGRPNVVLEAMASGLAVVATNVGGVAELIADGQTGLLVAAEDEAALAGAIKRLGGSADERNRLGRAARARIESDGLSWAATAEQFEAVLRPLTDRPR